MDELDKGLRISLTGAARTAALRDFRRQIGKWKVALPPAECLVADFGLGDFRKVGLIESWIANDAKAGYCGKYLFVFDGQTCPEHRHCEKHETFFIVKGRVRMQFEGRVIEMKEGDVLPVPPGKPHTFTGQGPALLLEVSKPCRIADNYFTDRRIPIGNGYQPHQEAGR